MNYRARYYNPNIGRFISEDPARTDLNLYQAFINSPVEFKDPLGLVAVVIDKPTVFKWSIEESTRECRGRSAACIEGAIRSTCDCVKIFCFAWQPRITLHLTGTIYIFDRPHVLTPVGGGPSRLWTPGQAYAHEMSHYAEWIEKTMQLAGIAEALENSIFPTYESCMSSGCQAFKAIRISLTNELGWIKQ